MSTPSVRRIFNAAQVRFRNARPGSVLILVVALLVLMALIGTAALTTNTIDRYATQQNAINTETDLLVEGVKNMAKSVIVGDLIDPALSPPKFRPDEAVAKTYDNSDMPLSMDLSIPYAGGPYTGMDQTVYSKLLIANDAWLAPRYPSLLHPEPTGPGTFGTFNIASNPPVWDSLSAPLNMANGLPSSGATLFEVPFSGFGAYGSGTVSVTGAATPLGFNWRTTVRTPFSIGAASFPNGVQLIPGYIETVQYGASQFVKYDPPLPAFTLPDPRTGTLLKFPAGDADGDGIADSALVKIPVGEINGVTFYYGSRIIDNNAAINVNTAWSRDFEFDGAGNIMRTDKGSNTGLPLVSGFFPSGVGLAEVLKSYNAGAITQMDGNTGAGLGVGSLSEIDALNQYRFGVAVGATQQRPRPSGVINSPNGGNITTQVYGSSMPATRTDFAYNTMGELLHFGLGRRLNNPDFSNIDTAHFQRTSVSDSISLAYRFVLKNPDASQSNIETLLGLSLAPPLNIGKSYLTAVGPGQALSRWYADNFNWDREFGANGLEFDPVNTFMSRRSMLVAENGVSNLMARPDATLPFGAYPPNACKASLNTGTWSDLARAFFNVMAENVGTTAYDTPYSIFNAGQTPPTDVKDLYAYTGMRFANPTPSQPTALNNQDETNFVAMATNDRNPQLMFRNSLRDHDATRIGDPNATTSVPNASARALQFSPGQMMVLRAAIAAQNVIAMRSPDKFTPRPSPPLNMTARLNGADIQVQVTTYGVKQQPYITEVFAQTNTTTYTDPDTLATYTNAEPYVAVELFYPYRIARQAGASVGTLGIGSWSLQMIDRERNTNGTFMSITPLVIDGARTTLNEADTPTGDGAYFLENVSTPEFGSYILLENYKEDGTGPAKYRPKSSQLPLTGSITAIHSNTVHPPLVKIYVQDLGKLIGVNSGTSATRSKELVIMQPTSGGPGYEMPIDSFDFAGLVNDSNVGDGTGHVWHYVRQGQVTGGFGRLWGMIYPGRYDPGKTDRRHQGIQSGSWTLGGASPQSDPFDNSFGAGGMAPDPAPTLGVMNGVSADNAVEGASYPVRHYIQLLNRDQPGFNPLNAAGTNKFPFGAFARVSDVMQVPFIGAYRVKLIDGSSPPPDIEINALPMDCAFAEDTDLNDDERKYVGTGTYYQGGFEQIGRFCPITNLFSIDPVDPETRPYDDLNPAPGTSYRYGQSPTGNDPVWRYRWTTRIFDYLTVQDPQSDYTPNVDPRNYTVQPIPTSNDGGAPGGDAAFGGTPDAENGVAIQGLVNINTAPWRVLAALPLIPPWPKGHPMRDQFTLATTSVDAATGQYTLQDGPDGVDDNLELAKLIVWYRDGIQAPGGAPVGQHGPFRSMYDLYNVAGLRHYYDYQLLPPNGTEPDDFDGDFSPYNPTLTVGVDPPTDLVRNDYEERFGLLNRLSNLITTRSDSFTVYIVVEGWRNAGSTDATKPPRKVVERRAAFIADRSGIGANGGQLRVINVPTE